MIRNGMNGLHTFTLSASDSDEDEVGSLSSIGAFDDDLSESSMGASISDDFNASKILSSRALCDKAEEYEQRKAKQEDGEDNLLKAKRKKWMDFRPERRSDTLGSLTEAAEENDVTEATDRSGEDENLGKIVEKEIVAQQQPEEEKKVEENNNNNNKKVEADPSSYRNNDFFAESPYLDAFVNKEMHTVAVVAETMSDIAEKTRVFAENGLKMANATRRLASSCKLDPKGDATSEDLKAKRKALEPEVVEGWDRLGDVLDEIASAQEHLCKFLTSYMVNNMLSIAANDSKTRRMRDAARKETDEAEQLFMKYCRGGKDSWGSLDGDANRESLRSRRSTARFSLYGAAKPETISPAVTLATKVARWKHDLLRMRTTQTSAELKRYQLATHITHSKYQQNVDISKCAHEMVTEMRSYFSHCADLVTALTPRTNNAKMRCEEFQAKHEMKHWGERESVLLNMLSLASQTENDAQLEIETIAQTRQSMLDPSLFTFDLAEENAQLWDLPATLSSYSGHNRLTAKGVMAEGWLNRRTGSLISGTVWTRGWFLIRKEGVFALQACSEEAGTCEVPVEKVKVCELQLCTVREMQEVKGDPSTRYCFELITPSNYSERLFLQARGPYELKMWLDAIRLGISCQLAAGESTEEAPPSPVRQPKQRPSLFGRPVVAAENNPPPPSRQSMFGRPAAAENNAPAARPSARPSLFGGPPAERNAPLQRMASEIGATVFERGRSMFFSKVLEEEDSSDDDGEMTPQVKQLMKANPTCADCGEGAPDWVSLNLGILICLECSGTHRSLGVHISKVRSLALDALSDRESGVLLSLGNECVNQYWEKEAPDDCEQRKTDREKWIKRKYLNKEFIGTDADYGGSEETACRNLYEASKRADIIGITKALIYGGKVNWKNPDDDNKTAIEVCGDDNQESGKMDECEELLLQSGAEMVDKSEEEPTESPVPKIDFTFRLGSVTEGNEDDNEC